MTTRIGDLTERVVIQRYAGTSDGMGGTDGTWEDVKTVWAAIEPLGGRQLLEAQRTASRITHKIFIRTQGDLVSLGSANPDVVHSNRIMQGLRTWAIHAVIDRGALEGQLELLCEEGVVVS